MPKWSPCKRRIFIKKLIKLGFNAPEPGGRHFYMRHGTKVLTVPSNDEYSVPQLRMMIKEVENIIGRTITLEEWVKL
ncbi:MAG TPA: type II toxin-antitoxin system HicA family toxin [Candidatus Methanoperedens sp.]